jgi:hypothetical protein
MGSGASALRGAGGDGISQMTTILLIAVLALAGCASNLAFFAVFVNLDKGVIPEGGITVSPDCAVSLTNTRVITTTTVTTTPQPATLK